MTARPPEVFPPLSPDVSVTVLSPAAAEAVERQPPAADLVATVITYHRPQGLVALVVSLAAQTCLPRRVIVVDNGSDPGTAGRLAPLAAAGCEVVLLTPPRNVGPAGATAMAMSLALGSETPGSESPGSESPESASSAPASSSPGWLTILNDDLVFSHPAILERMLEFARSSVAADPAVAAVGRIGHRFDRAWARLSRPPEADRETLPPAIDVDYLTTGSARSAVGQPVPMLRLDAVHDVGPFWADLFIGMTEVEYGQRLRRGGYRLVANGDLWRQPPPPDAPAEAPGPVERTPGRRYYSARNLTVIARVYGRWWTAVWVSLSRVGARSLALASRPSRRSWAHLRATVAGIADAWRSRLGARAL